MLISPRICAVDQRGATRWWRASSNGTAANRTTTDEDLRREKRDEAGPQDREHSPRQHQSRLSENLVEGDPRVPELDA